MSADYSYSAFGLSFRSQIHLPELQATCDLGEPDVSIRIGTVPESLESPSKRGVLYQAGENQFLLRVDRVARYLVPGGTEITIQPAPGSLDGDVRVFLLGSCLGALLHQRGVLALHASSIQTDAGAVLFAGSSGMGKSTTLGAFLRRGYPMLSDDIASIALDDSDSPVVMPAFPRTKLWADSAQRLGHDITSLTRVRPKQEKYEIAAHDRFADKAVPPHHVYLLTTSNKDELRLEQVENLDRFKVLLNNAYRVGFLDGLSLQPAHFQLASAVANKVPVTRVVRPHNPERLDELIDLIEADFLAPRRGVAVPSFPATCKGEPVPGPLTSNWNVA